MGQVLHGCATTTHAVRAAIQRSKAPIAELALRHGLNRKTVMKWRARGSVQDAPMGPKAARSTVLTPQEEAMAVAFRRHTLLALDDRLYALQASIPHLTRSSLHRLFQRHDISRLPAMEGDKTGRKIFKAYPIGYFHVDIAEVRTGEGKLHMLVGHRPDVQVRLCGASRAGQPPDGRGLPAPADRGRSLQGSHRADRQRDALHHAGQRLFGRQRHPRRHRRR